jgi:CRP-like cAMP-binding protein
VQVGELTPGCFFGELALVNDAPRAATVYAAAKQVTSALYEVQLHRYTALHCVKTALQLRCNCIELLEFV